MTTVVAFKEKSTLPELTIEQVNKWLSSPPENSRRVLIPTLVATYILDQLHPPGSNRRKKPKDIRRYAAYMKEGRWYLTGDTIKFGWDGLLKDGQNRLRACIQAGVSFPTHVVFGVDPAHFEMLDRGKVRTSEDVFAIAGYSYPAATAAAVRWIVLLMADEVKTRKSFEPEFLRREYQKLDADALEECIKVAKQIQRLTHQSAPQNAALYYVLRAKNAKKADAFFNGWAGSAPCVALIKVQKKLMQMSSENNGRVHDVVRAALMIQAWNCFIKGHKGRLVNFGWTLNKPFPAIES